MKGESEVKDMDLQTVYVYIYIDGDAFTVHLLPNWSAQDHISGQVPESSPVSSADSSDLHFLSPNFES